jgi:hypothetical protein
MRQLTTSPRFIHGSSRNHQHKLERLRMDQSRLFMHVPGFGGQEDLDVLQTIGFICGVENCKRQ